MTVSNRNSVTSLKLSIKKTKDEAQKTRIRAVMYAKTGSTAPEIASMLIVSKYTVSVWVRKYNKGGVKALSMSKGGRPKGSQKWDNKTFKTLSKEIDKSAQYWSIPIMQEWIKNNFNKEIPESTIWYRITQLDYSHKSARPNPCKGDKRAQAKFKKGVSKRHWSR